MESRYFYDFSKVVSYESSVDTCRVNSLRFKDINSPLHYRYYEDDSNGLQKRPSLDVYFNNDTKPYCFIFDNEEDMGYFMDRHLGHLKEVVLKGKLVNVYKS